MCKRNPGGKRRLLKGTYCAKSTFTWCLDINVCWQCVNNHPTMIKIQPLLIFESPLNQVSLTRPAVLTLTAAWRRISGGGVTGVDWQPCVAIVSALSGYGVLHFLCARAAVKSTMSRKQSRALCLDARLNMSLHFLPTSELLRALHLWD